MLRVSAGGSGPRAAAAGLLGLAVALCRAVVAEAVARVVLLVLDL